MSIRRHRRSFTIDECQLIFPKKGIRQYSIINEVSLIKDKVIKNVFTRDVSLEVLESLQGDSVRVVSLKTHSLQLLMNGEASGNNTLANTLATVYDELILKIRYDGSISTIINLEYIQERWKLISQDIRTSYSGREIKRLLEKIASKLNSEELVIQEIQQYNFFGLLLKEIYGTFDNITPIRKKQWVSTFAKSLEIEEEIFLEEINDEMVSLVCSYNKKEKQDISYSGIFRFNKETNWLENAEVQLSEQNRSSLFRVTQIEE
ncbi:hypothetical protein [Aquimarina sp. RZ0]|uniref:hypothetical protein n=1 Tax=Aquimarina sp. RZ0 TaxID=2607730 RepID=UPI0011F3F4F8|nr:hypothetical protein [Aquimarina sp. RZ0]KAA1242357.1 hypothetical protein F0000_25945 [Aquimarina sp. RZ0]